MKERENMKKISCLFSLLFIALLTLFVTSCSNSSNEYFVYSHAKENGYTEKFDTWDESVLNGDILLRMVDKDIEWSYSKTISWNEVYSSLAENELWYDEFVLGNVYSFDQYYTVKFVSNCATQINSIVVLAGSTISEPTTPTNNGYFLADWVYTNTATSFYFNQTKINKTTSIEIIWLSSSIYPDYKITYYLDGGVNSPNNPETYKTISNITFEDATKDGYNFAGWYKEASFINEIESISNYFGNLSLYAKWEGNVVTATFNADGGQLDTSSMNIEIGTKVVLPKPTFTGYKFIGWYNGDVLVEDGTWNIENDITLKAKWELVQYDITYTLYDGTNNSENLDTYNIETEFALKNATKTGYSFLGWYSDSNYTTKVTNLSKDTGSITLHAKWEEETYNITYVLNQGSLYFENETTTSISSDEFRLNLPTKNGYVFGYWCADDSLTDIVYYLNSDLLEYAQSSTITLYATYTNTPHIFEDFGIYGDSINCLYFGSYPQKVVLDDDLSSNLDNVVSVNSDGYYEYNDGQYAKVVANLGSMNMSKWEDGTAIVNGKTYYFKVEPIKWRVLQNNGTLEVLSDYILDKSVFNTTNSSQTIDGVTIYSNNYEYSTMRSFLNNDFINKALNTSEQNIVKTSLVDNSLSTTNNASSTYICNNTNDKMYLLSYQDSISTDFGFSESSSKKTRASDYAVVNGVSSSTGAFADWALRSPSNTTLTPSSSICVVSTYGYTSQGYSNVLTGHGIRPAFTFNF